MKKVLCVLLALLLALSAASAEEAPALSFKDLSQLEWFFSSGVGAWFTSFQMDETGAFTGQFHDGEMGEIGEGYPNGTQYGCLFHGLARMGDQIDETTWELFVDSLELDEGQVPECIEDGVRYVTTDPYGIYAGQRLLLYLPGKPIQELPEGFLPWGHLYAYGDDVIALPYYALYDAQEETGFVGDEYTNPWEEVSWEAFQEKLGLALALPQGAVNAYNYIVEGENGLSGFFLDNEMYTLWVVPSDTWQDISGLDYEWSQTEDTAVGPWPAKLYEALDGETAVSLCLWQDGAGRMYSLSAYTDGLTVSYLPEIAAEICAPLWAE